MSAPHQMTRLTTPEQDVEEWACTECSRRLLIHRPPAFEQVVLDPGDEWAAHVGGTGGAQAAGMPAHPAGAVSLSDHERNWLAENGITWETDGNA